MAFTFSWTIWSEFTWRWRWLRHLEGTRTFELDVGKIYEFSTLLEMAGFESGVLCLSTKWLSGENGPIRTGSADSVLIYMTCR